MATAQHTAVVGVFEDRARADQAVAELLTAGFSRDQIGVAMRNIDEEAGVETTTEDTYAEEGGLAGALTGLGLGALAGVGVLAGVIPVVGPAIAGGTLGIILSNAALGAGAVGLAGALIGWGIPEEEAKYYHTEFEAGRTIVTVNDDVRPDVARAILHRHGGYNMGSRPSIV